MLGDVVFTVVHDAQSWSISMGTALTVLNTSPRPKRLFSTPRMARSLRRFDLAPPHITFELPTDIGRRRIIFAFHQRYYCSFARWFAPECIHRYRSRKSQRGVSYLLYVTDRYFRVMSIQDSKNPSPCCFPRTGSTQAVSRLVSRHVIIDWLRT